MSRHAAIVYVVSLVETETMTTEMTAAIRDSTPIQTTARSRTKNDKIIYFTTTGIVAGVMLWSAYNFSFNPEMKGAFAHLGLPTWFRIELTTAKVLGSLVLLIPAIPKRIKEFAYFGFAITLISASIAHLSSGDGLLFEIFHSMFFISLTISYIYYHKANDAAK